MATTMLLGNLRREVLEANLEVVRRGLVLYTFGNASGISRDEGYVVIKPSGVSYDELKPEDMVITNLDGAIVEGELRPSSDLATHLVLYRKFPSIGGVVHTHSEFATAWAQAGRPIPCLGTTHADSFHGAVPVTEHLIQDEIERDYERNTGVAICRTFEHLDPDSIPAVLVRGHGPFCWGENATAAAHNAVILEAVARMAFYTVELSEEAGPLSNALRDKHFLRKHGRDAYYGQTVGKH
ncbi:MAG: L-ribulose-5-phosphate 4-epimerase [Candidatus Acidiferrales bacterium]